MNLDAQLEPIRTQSKGDFKFTMMALGRVTGALKSVNEALQGVSKDFVGHVKITVARQEEGFELMLEALQHELRQRPEMDAIADPEMRIQALEAQMNAAA